MVMSLIDEHTRHLSERVTEIVKDIRGLEDEQSK